MTRRRNLAKWHANNHKRRAAELCARAAADPNTRCYRCGHRLDHPSHRYPSGRRSVWHADHVDDDNHRSMLVASASLCNERAGADRANRRFRRPERISPNRLT